MEIGTIKIWLCSIVAFLGIMLCTFLVGYGCRQNSPTINEVEKVDTLFIHDTITQYEPIIEERVVLEKIFVPVTDTLWQHDTLYVYMEREQVVWQDSLARVYASGIMPQIDSVQHFVGEVIVTMEKTRYVKKPCKWSVGVQAGYGGAVYDSKVILSPYIGIGVTYNLISW